MGVRMGSRRVRDEIGIGGESPCSERRDSRSDSVDPSVL